MRSRDAISDHKSPKSPRIYGIVSVDIYSRQARRAGIAQRAGKPGGLEEPGGLEDVMTIVCIYMYIYIYIFKTINQYRVSTVSY